MDTTLVIIDMQPKFDSSNEHWLIDSILEKIKEFKRKLNPIIVIEYWSRYNSQCPTHTAIMNEIGDYQYAEVIYKPQNAGGCVLFNALSCLNFPRSLVVCGVNTDCCVYETVKEYLEITKDYEESPKVEVIRDCCNASFKTGHEWAPLEVCAAKHENLVLV